MEGIGLLQPVQRVAVIVTVHRLPRPRATHVPKVSNTVVHSRCPVVAPAFNQHTLTSTWSPSSASLLSLAAARLVLLPPRLASALRWVVPTPFLRSLNRAMRRCRLIERGNGRLAAVEEPLVLALLLQHSWAQLCNERPCLGNAAGSCNSTAPKPQSLPWYATVPQTRRWQATRSIARWANMAGSLWRSNSLMITSEVDGRTSSSVLTSVTGCPSRYTQFEVSQ